jgi:hypothetical protein
MNNKKIHKIITVPAFIALSSSFAFAGIPTLPIPSVVLETIEEIREGVEYIEENRQKFNDIMQNGTFFKKEIENANAIGANTIARINNMQEQLRDNDALNDSEPDKDACSTVTATLVEGLLEKAADYSNALSIEVAKNKASTFGLNQGMQKRKREELVLDTIVTCESLQASGEPGAVDQSICNNTDLLFSAAEVLTPEESKAVSTMIDIMADIKPIQTDEALLMSDTPLAREAKLQYMRENIFKNMVKASMDKTSSYQKPLSGGVSTLAAMMKMDKERFGDAEWMKDIANVQPVGEGKNDIVIEEIHRKQLALTAFMTHMMMLQFQQINDSIEIQAAQLARLNDMAGR